MRQLFILLLVLIPFNAQAQNAGDGVDQSTNAVSLAGHTLIKTINANPARKGLYIQANCTAGAKLVYDNTAGSIPSTIFTLPGGSTYGSQGPAISLIDIPHKGRIRIYSVDAVCNVPAREY